MVQKKYNMASKTNPQLDKPKGKSPQQMVLRKRPSVSHNVVTSKKKKLMSKIKKEFPKKINVSQVKKKPHSMSNQPPTEKMQIDTLIEETDVQTTRTSSVNEKSIFGSIVQEENTIECVTQSEASNRYSELNIKLQTNNDMRENSGKRSEIKFVNEKKMPDKSKSDRTISDLDIYSEMSFEQEMLNDTKKSLQSKPDTEEIIPCHSKADTTISNQIIHAEVVKEVTGDIGQSLKLNPITEDKTPVQSKLVSTISHPVIYSETPIKQEIINYIEEPSQINSNIENDTYDHSKPEFTIPVLCSEIKQEVANGIKQPLKIKPDSEEKICDQCKTDSTISYPAISIKQEINDMEEPSQFNPDTEQKISDHSKPESAISDPVIYSKTFIKQEINYTEELSQFNPNIKHKTDHSKSESTASASAIYSDVKLEVANDIEQSIQVKPNTEDKTPNQCDLENTISDPGLCSETSIKQEINYIKPSQFSSAKEETPEQSKPEISNPDSVICSEVKDEIANLIGQSLRLKCNNTENESETVKEKLRSSVVSFVKDNTSICDEATITSDPLLNSLIHAIPKEKQEIDSESCNNEISVKDESSEQSKAHSSVNANNKNKLISQEERNCLGIESTDMEISDDEEKDARIFPEKTIHENFNLSWIENTPWNLVQDNLLWKDRLPPPPGCESASFSIFAKSELLPNQSTPKTLVSSEQYLVRINKLITGQFEAEFEINNLPTFTRNYVITKGITENEINEFSGAYVSLEGQWIPSNLENFNVSKEKSLKPVCIYIRGSNEISVQLAVRLIEKLITEGEDLEECCVVDIPVELTYTVKSFDLCSRIQGTYNNNFQYIMNETGAEVTLRGKGSGYLEHGSNTEDPQPLYIKIRHKSPEKMNEAKDLVTHLVTTVSQEYKEFSDNILQSLGCPTITQSLLPAPVLPRPNSQDLQTVHAVVNIAPVFTGSQPFLPVATESQSVLPVVNTAPVVTVPQTGLSLISQSKTKTVYEAAPQLKVQPPKSNLSTSSITPKVNTAKVSSVYAAVAQLKAKYSKSVLHPPPKSVESNLSFNAVSQLKVQPTKSNLPPPLIIPKVNTIKTTKVNESEVQLNIKYSKPDLPPPILEKLITTEAKPFKIPPQLKNQTLKQCVTPSVLNRPSPQYIPKKAPTHLIQKTASSSISQTPPPMPHPHPKLMLSADISSKKHGSRPSRWSSRPFWQVTEKEESKKEVSIQEKFDESRNTKEMPKKIQFSILTATKRETQLSTMNPLIQKEKSSSSNSSSAMDPKQSFSSSANQKMNSSPVQVNIQEKFDESQNTKEMPRKIQFSIVNATKKETQLSTMNMLIQKEKSPSSNSSSTIDVKQSPSISLNQKRRSSPVQIIENKTMSSNLRDQEKKQKKTSRWGMKPKEESELSKIKKGGSVLSKLKKSLESALQYQIDNMPASKCKSQLMQTMNLLLYTLPNVSATVITDVEKAMLTMVLDVLEKSVKTSLSVNNKTKEILEIMSKMKSTLTGDYDNSSLLEDQNNPEVDSKNIHESEISSIRSTDQAKHNAEETVLKQNKESAKIDSKNVNVGEKSLSKTITQSKDQPEAMVSKQYSEKPEVENNSLSIKDNSFRRTTDQYCNPEVTDSDNINSLQYDVLKQKEADFSKNLSTQQNVESPLLLARQEGTSTSGSQLKLQKEQTVKDIKSTVSQKTTLWSSEKVSQFAEIVQLLHKSLEMFTNSLENGQQKDQLLQISKLLKHALPNNTEASEEHRSQFLIVVGLLEKVLNWNKTEKSTQLLHIINLSKHFVLPNLKSKSSMQQSDTLAASSSISCPEPGCSLDPTTSVTNLQPQQTNQLVILVEIFHKALQTHANNTAISSKKEQLLEITQLIDSIKLNPVQKITESDNVKLLMILETLEKILTTNTSIFYQPPNELLEAMQILKTELHNNYKTFNNHSTATQIPSNKTILTPAIGMQTPPTPVQQQSQLILLMQLLQKALQNYTNLMDPGYQKSQLSQISKLLGTALQESTGHVPAEHLQKQLVPLVQLLHQVLQTQSTSNHQTKQLLEIMQEIKKILEPQPNLTIFQPELSLLSFTTPQPSSVFENLQKFQPLQQLQPMNTNNVVQLQLMQLIQQLQNAQTTLGPQLQQSLPTNLISSQIGQLSQTLHQLQSRMHAQPSFMQPQQSLGNQQVNLGDLMNQLQQVSHLLQKR